MGRIIERHHVQGGTIAKFSDNPFWWVKIRRPYESWLLWWDDFDGAVRWLTENGPRPKKASNAGQEEGERNG